MKQYNKKKIYYWVLGTLVAAGLLIVIIQFVTSLAEMQPNVYKTDEEYLNLFSDESRSKVKEGITYKSKNRNSISTLDYDQEKYSLIIYKINADKDILLRNISMIERLDRSYITGSVYTRVNEGYFNLWYASSSPDLATAINIYNDGDPMQVLNRNDSILLLNLNTKNLALTYNSEDEADIFIESRMPKTKLSIDMLFLKRNNNVYLVYMFPNRPKVKQPAGLVYSLFK